MGERKPSASASRNGAASFTHLCKGSTVTRMSETAPCSCRLPWIVTVIALGVLVAERFVMLATPPSANAPSLVVAPTATPPSGEVADARLTTLKNELNEIRRVLDDAQSALGQRDREIATANDELRVLRMELDSMRAKNAVPAP
jgi:hypothetical protein